MKLIVALIFFTVIFAGGVSAQPRRSPQKPAPKAVVYACPMHPDQTSSKRGRCRKCGMELRPVKPQPAPTPTPEPVNSDASSSFTSAKIPDARIYDQHGKQLNFYNDLIKGQTVAINFIFTTCTTICPPLSATFRKVQQDASQRGLGVKLISISVDPTVDTPERLRAYAEKFNAGADWTFVTGDKGDIDTLLKSLGVAVTDKNDHTPMILIGNDMVDYWTRTYGLASPSKLVDLIADAASRK